MGLLLHRRGQLARLVSSSPGASVELSRRAERNRLNEQRHADYLATRALAPPVRSRR
jgi:hypothetical protein